MELVIAGLGLFLSAALTATLLQVRFQYNYAKNPIAFISLFLVCIVGSFWFLNYFPPVFLVVSIGCVAGLYVAGIPLLAKFWKPMQHLCGAETVPLAYRQGLIRPGLTEQLVKVTEIALQDMAAWIIVGGLIIVLNSVSFSMFVFAGIVFVLHIPGLWMFGRVYGMYFLVLSTVVAFIVPWLYQIEGLGFVYLYTMHLSGYVAMYIFMGFLGKRS
jgi:hypothetical protein